MKLCLLGFAAILSVSCGSESASPQPTPASQPNILLLIADDLGVDSFAPYAEAGREYASTPALDEICRGVRFTNVWSGPTCSPTRATILTGRFGFRTGVLTSGPGTNINPDEQTLPQVLTAQAPEYVHANIGKWHLGTSNILGGDSAPNNMGWSYYSGSLSGALPDYSNWQKTVNGTTNAATDYATTVNVDDAIEFIATSGESPWFVWLAFNAPHTPFHLPPSDLHSHQELSGEQQDITDRPEEYYRSMIEAMDSEVGRLLASIDKENTIILFLGDNGTPSRVVAPPWVSTRAKDTLYQGGVHVPLCADGAFVQERGRQIDSLVQTADLFSTILEAAGATPPAGTDSLSFYPAITNETTYPKRSWNLTESSSPAGRAIRDDQYKLIVYEDGTEELYDLLNDFLETSDLIDSVAGSSELSQAYAKLKSLLEDLSE